MADSIKESYETEIVFKAKENVTSEIQKMEKSIAGLQKTVQSLNTGMYSMLGLIGIQGLSSLSHMATSVTEIQNRLELLNSTVVDTKLSFKDMIRYASESRSSLEDFAEMFNRIGLTSGHYFKENPEQLVNAVSTLYKQFQLMHLSPSQLMSVQTSILDAFELGYFDWRHLKSGMMHDNPLFRGWIKSMGLEGSDITELSRNHMLKTEDFLQYVLSLSEDVNTQFDQMTITLSQFGSIMKNEIVEMFSDLLTTVTEVVNIIYKGYVGIKSYAPHILLLVKSFLEAVTILAVVSTIMKAIAIASTIWAGMTTIATGGLAVLTGGLFAFSLLKGIPNYYDSKNGDTLETKSSANDKKLNNIDKNVQGIHDKMGLTRQSLNDLVTRTENLLIHNNFQNNFNISGQYSERELSEKLVNILKKDLAVNGVRY